MLAAAGEFFKWNAVKLAIASDIVAGLTSVGALFVSQSKVFFKERVSPHSVLPGWYKKCEEIWYYDYEYSVVVPDSQSTYYVFKA